MRREDAAGAIGGILRASTSSCVGVRGQRVRLAVLVHLQAMFHVAQELVGGAQPRVLARGEKSLVPQAAERQQGAAVAHPGLAAAVQALQALDQKLDIADAAGRRA